MAELVTNGSKQEYNMISYRLVRQMHVTRVVN